MVLVLSCISAMSIRDGRSYLYTFKTEGADNSFRGSYALQYQAADRYVSEERPGSSGEISGRNNRRLNAELLIPQILLSDISMFLHWVHPSLWYGGVLFIQILVLWVKKVDGKK